MDGKHPRQLRPAESQVHHQTDDDDYKAAAKGLDEPVDYKQFMPKLKPERRVIRRTAKIVIISVIIAGLGYGAYYIGSHYTSNNPMPTKAPTTTTSRNKLESPTRTYTSSNQNLTFSYPADWKITETSTLITGTSPIVKLTSYNHRSVNGRITFTIRAQSGTLPEFKAGAAMAVLPSQIVTYTSPASDQRGSTYISFLSYADSKGFGIDGIYITGNAGYKTGQNVPESDIQAIDPVVSVTFMQCINEGCGSTSSLVIATSDWSDKSFSAPLLAMLESLTIS